MTPAIIAALGVAAAIIAAGAIIAMCAYEYQRHMRFIMEDEQDE